MQIAALGVTLAISIFSGALSGFIAGRCPMPDYNFDDTMHFEDVDYSDQISKYSPQQQFKHAATVSVNQS